MSCEADIAAVLRSSGQKVTPQRILILSSVCHAGGHVTASQIHDTVRKNYPFVDASTVYRTLAVAKDLRLVSETNLGSGENLFEWVGGHRHHHLICRNCNGVVELADHHIDDFIATLEKETGFKADMDHIGIFGLCGHCARTVATAEKA